MAWHQDEEGDGDWLTRHDADLAPIALCDGGSNSQNRKVIALEVADAESRNCGQQRAVLGDTCAICLQNLEDPVMLRGCHHVYCLACLSSWVRNLVLHGVRAPTCPLCKRVFHAAYADVVSETEYEIVYFDGRATQRNKTELSSDGAQRRAMIYTRRMRLAKINGVDVVADQPLDKLPAPVKRLPREYSEWLQRELRVCVGPHLDLTVLLALIDAVVGSPVKRHVDWRALQDALEPFLADDTVIFVLEFAYFLHSRLNLQAYDSAIEYCCTSDTTFPCGIASCAARHSM